MGGLWEEALKLFHEMRQPLEIPFGLSFGFRGLGLCRSDYVILGLVLTLGVWV